MKLIVNKSCSQEEDVGDDEETKQQDVHKHSAQSAHENLASFFFLFSFWKKRFCFFLISDILMKNEINNIVLS